MKSQLHIMAQNAIKETCKRLSYPCQLEYQCDGYRPDVMVFVGEKRYAFEIQLTEQSLEKTIKRQSNYIRDDIVGCWLFEKEPSKMSFESERLPIFKLVDQKGSLYVSLKGRKVLPLDQFIEDFIKGKIKFCQHIKPLPKVTVNFIKFPCWKCGKIHHIYYLDNFHTACNIDITIQDRLWDNKGTIFNDKVIKAIQKYTNTEEGKHIVLPIIKERFSHTVGTSYMSFGCSECDSIFGDFYIHEAVLEEIYNTDKDSFTIEADIELNVPLFLPHWCHPGSCEFCE